MRSGCTRAAGRFPSPNESHHALAFPLQPVPGSRGNGEGTQPLNRQVWIGLVISFALLWLSARNVEFDRAWAHIQTINLIYLVPYALLVIGEVVIRVLKWQVLLRPVKACSFWKLNSATIIGLMANNVLPARAGEFVRAYAGARLESIPYSMAFATVVIDRVLDGLTVSAIFLLVVLVQPDRKSVV